MDMKRPPYLVKEVVNGKTYWYFRINKGKRTHIEGKYGSDEFMKNYQAAYSGQTPEKINAKSIAWLIDRYKRSLEWTQLSSGSRKQRDHHFNHIRKSAGKEPYQAVSKQTIKEAMDARLKTPAAANNFLKAVRGLFKWACDAEYIESDPTVGVHKIKYKTDGFPAWSVDDAAKFREYWKIGTRERLAMELLFHTGLRRSDVVRLGKQHIKDGVAMLTTNKTGEPLYLPISHELQQIIKQSPTGDLALIATTKNMPRNKDAFGNWFREVCNKAGVKKSAHGLRKLAASLLAESGGTEKELQATFGWVSESQSKIYTRAADRKKLALNAGKKRFHTPKDI